jgi:hypothetical protein
MILQANDLRERHDKRAKDRARGELPQIWRGPVCVLAGEGEAAIVEAEAVVLLFVDEGEIPPALLPALHLEVVVGACQYLTALRLRSAPPEKPSASFHTTIVRRGAPLARG